MPTDAETPFELELRPPWLVASFASDQRVLSWASHRPGYQVARRVAWLQVRDADLPLGVVPEELLRQRLAAAKLADAVGLMTSSELADHRFAQARAADVAASCVLTLGLTNAERVGARRVPEPIDADSRPTLGTINLLIHLSQPLTDAALVEAISIATEARTTAIIGADHRLETGVVTGTGTDCIVVACARGPGPRPHAGLHTAVGEALGAAVLEVTSAAARDWRARFG